jgi:Tol biopolymer transport system component
MFGLCMMLIGIACGAEQQAASAPATTADSRTDALAREVRTKGWIMYGGMTSKGDMDLFLMRPDGSERRNVTNTPEYHEGAPRFSPDGRRVIYRRYSVNKPVHYNRWGFQGQVFMANADGSEPVAMGQEGELPWACWSPDGKQLSCLTMKGIEIIDLATRQVVRRLPRKGIYQQLYWSPDGKWFCGVSNAFGEEWTVVRMNVETGEINSVRKFQEGGHHTPGIAGQELPRGSECTPDWFPDSKHILFSHHPGARSGWTQLWMADGDGGSSRLVYAEDLRQIYGGTLSPDGKYVLFSRMFLDGAGALLTAQNMGLIRFADTPMVGGKSEELRKVHPKAGDGPVLSLPVGFEPDWTYAEVVRAH